MSSPPTETLTFFYTDIEGSTRLWQQHAGSMPAVLARHDELLRAIVAAHGGSVFRTMGDAVCAAFRTAGDALAAAVEAQRALLTEPWNGGIRLLVRMGLHTGAAEMRHGDYVGHTLNRIARLLAAGHGGQILLSDATRALLLDDLPPGVALCDLGEYRLKDLERGERIYQVEAPDLPATFPPLRTLDSVSTNLPPQTTSFVGREMELDAVVSLIRRPDVRLLTLLGPGGTGKTRLAIQVGAAVLDDYRDGVFFVPLAPVRDPVRVAPAIASALGIGEQGGMSPDERLSDHLRGRDIVLILDNFEQVLPAAPVISGLLAASSGLNVLVTSRSVLHLSAEHEYPVPPLGVPDPAHLPETERLKRYDAVALFEQRARAVRPDFDVTDANARAVAEICCRLDGLPLAIELAAARIRLFGPEALLKRLSSSLTMLTGGARDLPARQQTLRGAIDWSYSLLSLEEGRLFTRLAVFSGGWSLDAADAVCDVEGSLDMVNGLAALVEQSLIRQEKGTDEPRFGMLETLHDYASERLEASGEAAAMHWRHARWYQERFRGGPTIVADLTAVVRDLGRYAHDQDNILAAARWSLSTADWPGYATLLSPLCGIWFTQGRWTEAASWTEAAAATVPADRTLERAIVVFAAGFFLLRVGEYDRAAGRLEESISILRELRRKRELSTALYSLGELLTERGQGEAAWPLLEEALATSRETVHENQPMILTHLGILAREGGDFTRSRAYVEEAVAIARDLGHIVYGAVALNALADLSRLEGDYERAGSIYEELAALTPEADVPFVRPGQLHNLAYIAHFRGDDARAYRQFVEALGLYRTMGDRRGMAECVAGIAVLHAASDPAKATRLLAAAMGTASAIGSHLSSSNRGEYDRALTAIHARLDDAAFGAAWEEGQAMPLEVAIACATAMESGAPASIENPRAAPSRTP